MSDIYQDAKAMGLTAHDFIQHEKNVLGNNGIVIYPETDLHTLPAQYLHWVNKPNHAEDYFGHLDFNSPEVIAQDQDRYLVNAMPNKTAAADNPEGDDKTDPLEDRSLMIPLTDEQREFFKQLRQHRQNEAEIYEHNQRRPVDTSDPIDMKQHMMEAHGWRPEDGDFSKNTHWGHEAFGGIPDDGSEHEPDRELTHPELNKMHDWEHNEYQFDWPHATTLDNSHFHTAKSNASAYDFSSVEILHSKIGGYVLAKRQDGKVVAEALARIEDQNKRVFLTSLRVDEDQRRAGHGRAMVQIIAGLPEHLGYADAEQYSMSVLNPWDGALPFYGSLGATISTHKSSSFGYEDITSIVYWTPESRMKIAVNPMSTGNSKSEDDHKNRETSSCKTCGGDIYKINDGSVYPWQHDIGVGAGVPHQAFPDEDGSGAAGREEDYCVTCGSDIYRVNDGSVYDWVHHNDNGAGVPHQALPAGNSKTAANKPVKDMTPEEFAVYRKDEDRKNRAGRSWLRKNPATINNVVDHWNKATDDEKKAGMAWYEDAAHAARVVGDATGVGHSTMAGLIANYSPQAPWHQNLMYAIRSATEGKGVGGKGSGVMATASRADHADRILSGKHWKDVLGANPGATFSLKTRAFASLIEHGGDHDESNPQVCIDRHALSVVHGARLTDRAYSMSGISGKGRYADYSTQYVKAAKKISKQVGYKVHPHQVQAATWLARQRMNEEEDRANGRESNSAKQAAKAKEHYDNYMGENHPELIIPEPGTGYSKRDIGQLPEDVKAAYDLKQEFHGPDPLGSEPKTGSLSVDLRSAFFNFFGE